jgi:signal transduction histidine kinase
VSRVLIVDDNEVNLYLLRTVLEGYGFEVDEAGDGEQALEAASLALPDLVISDLLMPVMDGYTLLRRWRADARFRRIPFIVYTATYSEPQDRKLALELGADAYILKATEVDELIARVRETLASSTRREPERAGTAPADSEVRLKEYNEVLIHKLEAKSLELQQANLRLRQLSQRLMAVQEAERAAIARELHDEIGQALTAIKFNAQWLARRITGPESLKLTDCIELADRTLSQVRGLALELRPPQLDQLGLTAALRDLTERMSASASLQAQFAADSLEVAPGYAQATAAFRVAQEALTNVVRHAAADQVTVELRRRGVELVVTVTDNGRAFDLEEALTGAVKGRSMGLLGMQERVKLAGGWLKIESQPGQGTRVKAGFPVDVPVERRE